MWYPIRELWIYPIKGCRGLKVEKAKAEKRGFAMDRTFMFVDMDGRFVTQRTNSELARVSVDLRGPGLTLTHPLAGETKVRFPNALAPELSVSVWKDTVRAQLVDIDATWVHAALGGWYQLVYMAPHNKRPVDPKYGRESDEVSFADGFPFLVVNEASLHELNRHLDEPIGIERFRPSIVVAGDRPFQEDSWGRIGVSGLEFELVKPCTRCVVINTDQQTGERSPEPLKALAALRAPTSGGVVFGQNAIVRGRGWLDVHDIVEVL